MFAIVATLFNSFVRLLSYIGIAFQWLAYWLMQLWGAGLLVVQALLDLSASVIVFVLSVVTDLLLFVLTLAAGVLPNMPSGITTPGSFNVSSVNRYLPLGEVFSFGTVWAVIFGAIGAYKLAKFIRGAG